MRWETYAFFFDLLDLFSIFGYLPAIMKIKITISISVNEKDTISINIQERSI